VQTGSGEVIQSAVAIVFILELDELIHKTICPAAQTSLQFETPPYDKMSRLGALPKILRKQHDDQGEFKREEQGKCKKLGLDFDEKKFAEKHVVYPLEWRLGIVWVFSIVMYGINLHLKLPCILAAAIATVMLLQQHDTITC
jgi:hypothetical protein